MDDSVGVKEVRAPADSSVEGRMPETLFSIDDLLGRMVTLNASDLHITVGSHPVVRVRGRLERLEDVPALAPDETQSLLYRILSTEQQKQLEIKRNIDF